MANYILILKTFRQNPTIPIHAMVLNKLLIRYLMSKSEKKSFSLDFKNILFLNFFISIKPHPKKVDDTNSGLFF